MYKYHDGGLKDEIVTQGDFAYETPASNGTGRTAILFI